MSDVSDRPVSSLAPRLVVITAATIFGSAYSLSAALIALDLAQANASQTFIGVNAAMHAVGVLAMAFFLPHITARFGIRTTMLGAFGAVAIALIMFPVLPLLWLWFPLRIVLGAASETLFVLSETWMNSLSTDETRARSMALYTAAISVGFALGPLMLSLMGASGATYGLGATLILIALLCIALSPVRPPQFEKSAHENPVRYMQMAPIAVLSVTLNAAIETAGLSFLALYAIQLGWQDDAATRLMTCMMIGAILLQLPIGWLADKMNRMRLVRILAGGAALGALAWPLALNSTILTYALLFFWGGAFVGVYTVMLAVVGDRFQGTRLVGIYAAMGLTWGLGALLGPVLAGLAMEWTRHGLAYFAFLSCFAFLLVSFIDRSQTESS